MEKLKVELKEKTRKNREAQRRFKASQEARGYVQLNLWCPPHLVDMAKLQLEKLIKQYG